MKDFVVCKICNKKLKCINHRHLSQHNISSEEYKKFFNVKKLYCEKATGNMSSIIKNICKIEGSSWDKLTKEQQDSKREKHRKQMHERYKSNPKYLENHNKMLKKRYKNMTKEEKKNRIKNAQIASRKPSVRKKAGKSLRNRIKNDPILRKKMSNRMSGNKNIIYKFGVVDKIIATKKKNRSMGIPTKMDTKAYKRKQRLNAINKNSKNPHKRFTNTRPEREMKIILNELDIDYKHNYPVRNILHSYCADFYIPSTNTIIEVDGKFFHNYPCGTEKDKIRNTELKEAGFNVLRFWEGEFNKESVKEAIYNE